MTSLVSWTLLQKLYPDKYALGYLAVTVAVLCQGCEHRHNIFWRHLGLYIVHLVEDEAAAGRQDLDAFPHLLADFLWSAIGQDPLCIQSTAPEAQVFAKLTS